MKKKIKKSQKITDFNKERLTNTFNITSTCPNCSNKTNLNMPYKHAALLFRGDGLNYTCPNCNSVQGFNLSAIKHVIDGLPQEKRNHFYDWLSDNGKDIASSGNEPKEIHHHHDSGGEDILLIIIILVLLYLFWPFIVSIFYSIIAQFALWGLSH